MFNALLIDNDPKAIVALESMLEENCPRIIICGKVTTLDDAISFINRKSSPDIIFSEIDLPNHKGFELTANSQVAGYELVFVTENRSYALKAIKNQAIGFLLKPVKRKELLHVMNVVEKKILEKRISERDKIMVQKYEASNAEKDVVGIPTIEGFEILHVKEVIRCEGMQNCTRIITKDRSDIISSYNLGKFISLFGEKEFISPHKSHLVNIHHIKKYLREGTIIMNDGSQVPVSKRRKIDFLNYFRH